MDYFLKQVEPGNPHPLHISLHEDEMKIGRSTIASLSRYNRVSRYHATFTKRNDCWFLTDLRSLNCLYVNFKKVQNTVQLNIGDIIGFGSPSIAQDGGFVCVLAARNKVVVKQEPLDDDCIEIPVRKPAVNTMSSTRISITAEGTVKCLGHTAIDDLKNKPEALGSTSSPDPNSYVPKVSKVELTANHHQNFDHFPKLQSFQSKHLIADQPSVTSMGVDLKRTDLAMSLEVQKLVHVNPAITATGYNINEMKSINETTVCDLYGRETNSGTIEYNVADNQTTLDLISTQCPQMSAYPGIEYLEGISNIEMEIESLKKQAEGNTSSTFNLNPVQVIDLETVSNSCTVKQEIHSDLASNISKDNELNSSVLSGTKIALTENRISSSSAKDFQNYNNINEIGDRKPITNYFTNDSILNPVDQFSHLRVPNNLMKLEERMVRSGISPNNFSTASLTENTKRNIAVDNIHLNHCNKTNVKQEKHLNYNEISPNELLTARVMNNVKKPSNCKNWTDNSSVEGVNRYSTALPRELLSNNLETKKITDCPTIRMCSIPLVRCDSTNLQELLYISENSKILSTEKKKAHNEKIAYVCYAENSIKDSTSLKNLITETHGKIEFSNSANLKVENKKILDQDSGSSLNVHVVKNMFSNTCRETSTKANITVSRKPTEQFDGNISQNLNQRNETITEDQITMHKSLNISRTKIDNVKKHISNDSVSLGLNISKKEIGRSQKELDDAGHTPRMSVPVKRKHDTKSKHSSKRLKTKETEKNYSSLSSQSLIINSLSIDPEETIEANKMAIVSNVVCSKKRHSNEYSPLRSPQLYEAANEKTNVIPNQSGAKSMGRTLLIDSKPMEYRPRTRRGKEEWFQERSKEDLETENTFVTSTLKSSSRHDSQSTKKSNKVVLKNMKICCQKKKEKEAKFKYHQKSEERAYLQKKLEKNSKQHLRTDAHISQKPPVPRRRNSYSSRMGFLIDMPVSHKKSTNYDKQQTDISIKGKKNLQSFTTQPGTISSESKMRQDKPLDNEIPNKNKETTTKRNSTQTSNKSETGYSAMAEQHSIKFNQKMILIDQSFLEKGFPSFDMDYRLKDYTVCEQGKELLDSRIISDKVLNSDKPNMISNISNQSTNANTTYSKKVAIISPIPKVAEEIPKCDSSGNESKWLNVSSTLLIEMIVGWNPKWLEEQKSNKCPPPLITKNASYLNHTFSSYKSYVSSYFPMIVLEVWECLFRESKPFLEQFQNCNNFCFTIKSWENKRRLTELKCEAVVSDVLCYCPSKGKVILLNILDREEHGIKNYIFGCIRRHSIEEFKRGALEWENMPADALYNAKLVKFELSIKKIQRPMRLKSVYLAHGLLNIKDKMQLADALHSFRDSPISKDLFRPREESFIFCDSSRKPLSMVDLIQAVSKEVQNLKSKSKVLFIHAPPGTGKTKLVVDLINKLTNNNCTKTKILVCTPSYITLDDILRRLIELGNTGSSLPSMDSVKFVRLCEHERIEKIDSKLKQYSLLSKVEKLYQEDCRKKMHRRECELKMLEKKINDILFKQHNDHGQFRKINRDSTLQVLIKKMSSLKEKNLLHHMDEGFRKGYECIVLKESDVLLTTLESSMQPAARTFLKEQNFAYCIVDDATQCNELQLLQCLHHPQISKLILLGDLNQMSPNIFSEYAVKYGFGRSTIERFFHYYRKKYHKVPCFSLKEQHRMHSEICHFPSKYFYNQELQTANGIDEKFAQFPFKPYNVIDILDPEPISDETVSTLIVYICSILVQVAPTASVGVIVDRCGLPMPCEYSEVEVNTLEHLQGREKDIVLIPCIRPFAPSNDFLSCKKRLNVAITRAKQCLIICGRVSSQVQFPHWKALLDDAMNRNCYLCVASIKHIPLVFSNFIKKR